MKDFRINSSPAVKSVFRDYPENARKKLQHLRSLIIETAKEVDGVTDLVETLKWGEPSYLTRKGSTIRIDWKSKAPNQYAMYFQCTSKLIPTFKMMHGDTFEFEGSRAIVFQMQDDLPTEELKNCIAAALTYHKVKHLPTLGM